MRDPDDRVTISYRFPERLRVRLAAAAEQDGLNITQEITKCLLWCLGQNDRVGGRDNDRIGELVSMSIHAVEERLGRRWRDAPEAAIACQEAATAIIATMLKLPNRLLLTPEENIAADAAVRFGRDTAIEVLHEEIERLRDRQPVPRPSHDAVAAEVEAARTG